MSEIEVGQDLRRRLVKLPPDKRVRLAGDLADREGVLLQSLWPVWGHRGQHAPESDWRTWVIMAGRGFGKTRAGAEWITRQACDHGGARIALVAATIDEARRVMIEGEAGLLRVAAGHIASWQPSRRTLQFKSGAQATLFSGCSPEALRGPEHHFSWCDELAKWACGEDTWHMLQLGLRLGTTPRTVVTTTPKTGSILTRIMNEPGCFVTRGGSYANPFVSDTWVRTIEALYGGTRLAAQEIDGELLADEGALWSEAVLAACRVNGESTSPGTNGRGDDAKDNPFVPRDVEGRPAPFIRIAIGVDPPSGGGTCGIVLCGKDADGVAHVLADLSVTEASPARWAAVVAGAAQPPRNGEGGRREAVVEGQVEPAPPSALRAATSPFRGGMPIPIIVAEANQGGKMVEAVLHAADPGLRVKLVHASDNKHARADPVALKFTQGRVRLHGHFPELEAQLTGFASGGRYTGPGPSPDRADAMVWALTELLLRDEPLPAIRGL